MMTTEKDYTVACYYFPNYHVDSRNEAAHGLSWTEWELVRLAQPRFPGHRQPLVPLWGYEDEADPTMMAKKIDAASADRSQKISGGPADPPADLQHQCLERMDGGQLSGAGHRPRDGLPGGD